MHGLFFLQAEDGIRDYKVTGVQTLLFRSCSASGVNEASGNPDWVGDREERVQITAGASVLRGQTVIAVCSDVGDFHAIGRASCGACAFSRGCSAPSKYVCIAVTVFNAFYQ